MAKKYARKSFPKRARRSPRRVTKKLVRKTIRKVKNRVFRARVKSVILSTSETKYISVRNTKLCTLLNTGTAGLTQNMWILNPCQAAEVAPYGGIQGPLIGSQDGQREGNMIQVQKVFLNLVVTPEGYDPLTNPVPAPLNGRLWFFRSKRNKSLVPTTADLCGPNAKFFQDGLSASGFSGNLSDNLMHLNKDLYTYLGHKDFKLGFSSYVGSNAAGERPDDFYLSNNDYKFNYSARLNLTRYCPKKFTWDDYGVPTNAYTFCVIQLVAADGRTLLDNSIVARCVYDMGWYYKDV